MKLTKTRLKQIIKEELAALNEIRFPAGYYDDPRDTELGHDHGYDEEDEKEALHARDWEDGYNDGVDRIPLEKKKQYPPAYLEGYKEGLEDSHMSDKPEEKHAAAEPMRAKHASEMKARIAASQAKRNYVPGSDDGI